MTAWAFFKRIRWLVILYLLYIHHWFALNYLEFIQLWKKTFYGETPNIGGIEVIGDLLPSQVYTSFYMFLWLLALITIIVMLLETDYGDFCNRFHQRFFWIKQK